MNFCDEKREDGAPCTLQADHTPPHAYAGSVFVSVEETWLRRAMQQIFGCGDFVAIARANLGACGKLELRFAGEIGLLGERAFLGCNPIELLDAFRCAACGAHHRTENALHLGRRLPDGRYRARRVCDPCARLLDQGEASIFARDLALRIDEPEWQPGCLGLPIYIKAA